MSHNIMSRRLVLVGFYLPFYRSTYGKAPDVDLGPGCLLEDGLAISSK
jgi:hypothetical protein